MERTGKSLFSSQDNEDIKAENKRFFDYQKKYIKKHNLKHNSKQYINNQFLQRICTVMKKLQTKNRKNKTVEWLFGKAMDILIRENITDHKFINYNEEMKNCFYSYALYRTFEYALGTFDSQYSAFNYFTTTIRNSFKHEINEYNAQKVIISEIQKQNGLDAHLCNVDSNVINELEKDYEISYNVNIKHNIPMFITDVIERYKDKYTFKSLEISLNPNEPRFKRKKAKYDYFMVVKKVDENEIGIIFKYIDIFECNENKGQSKYSLQNEIKIAREYNHQTFYLFSDVYLNDDIPDEAIFKKIDIMINKILNDDIFSTGKDLMIDYISTNDFNTYKIDEPVWWYLSPKLEKRELALQSIANYKALKEKEPNCTRVFDGGYLNLKEFK